MRCNSHHLGHFLVVPRNARVNSMPKADWLVDAMWHQLTNQLCALTLPMLVRGTIQKCPTQDLLHQRNVHYNDVIMTTMASQFTSLTVVLFNRLFRRRSKKTSKLRVTGLCAGNSPVTAQGPVTRKVFPFDDVIMWWHWRKPLANFPVSSLVRVMGLALNTWQCISYLISTCIKVSLPLAKRFQRRYIAPVNLNRERWLWYSW